MVTSSSSRRASTPRTRARRTLDDATPRKRGGSRKTWITDPCALLDALAAGERTGDEAERRRVAPPEPVGVAPVVEEPPTEAWPHLREHERLGHARNANVVVIIRRRRAA
jgi:hypothetical protein